MQERGNEIILYKAVGTRSYEDRKDELDRYGITKERYFSLSDSSLPEEFFEDIDIVYIASPNKFHKSQTVQAIEHGKVTVTEKALATTKADFEEVVQLIRRKAEGRATVGLHYITKALTLELGRILPSLKERYGRILSISATFFEETREEDARREWLFKPENGGIGMDWIHPISIIAYTLKAERMKMYEVQPFIIQPLYDKENPTGFEAKYKVNGRYFLRDAVAVIRVAKGLDLAHKVMRLVFEDATVDLLYISTDEEFLTGSRGEIRIARKGMEDRVIRPIGPLSYEPMINDMLKMMKGERPMLSIDDIIRIYEPEWELQQGIYAKTSIQDKERIDEFVKDGLSHRPF